ncbi:alpha/beta fold hydrolase [Algoriphagus persicinus]|uniref:alpha/beta fold hydrolase n=1 Tax=Algoriphagus persicinus TaxID=3108754 RepID=UPI002B379DFA|nr:alpha/beta hydrolase [Algoriphagus sp. E1-3-M2]MEB2784467.1 alpha/beta hydrolase [Algoriphagus sp. E1-3-M2]
MDNHILIRNNVKVFGEGTQPILFAHGYGCDQKMWRFITPAFTQKYKVVVFDHLGSGESDAAAYDFDKYNHLSGYAEDLVEICEALSLENTILVGHSVSSIVGALAVAMNPDLFDQLIMLGPSPRYINDGDYFGGFDQQDIDGLVQTLEANYLGWSSFITPVIIGNPDKEEFATELKNSFCSMAPDIAKHFAKVTFVGDYRENLLSVTTPTLIIQSHPDAIAPVEVGKYVHANIPGSQYVEIASSGHCPHLTSPELVISAINTYLKN